MVDYFNHKMSGSEDEPEAHIQTGMTKAELRKSNKPIMEKRRRARINQCLEELKSLILEAMKKDPTRHSKLEKADILEMTVKHLQAVQRQQLSTAVATNPAVLTKFRTGFTECASEVSRYVSHLENVDPVVKQRLVSHLNNCVSNLQQISPIFSRYMPYMPERLYSELKVGFHNDFQNGDENNNGSARIQIPNGVQLIPSRLPTGELALLVPQSAAISANFPFFPPASESASNIGQSSAFTAVQRPQSPLLSPSTSTSSFGEESHQSEHYPRAQSPNHQPELKIPEQSPASKSFRSSPETQKPQISSTSDSTSPVPVFTEHKVDRTYPTRNDFVMDSLDILNGAGIAANLRQPLSVITDKTYNQSSHVVATRSEATKRRYDGLLVISNKRARYPESISSTVPIDSSNGVPKSGDDQPLPEEDLSEGPTCSTNRNSNSNPLKFDAVAGPSGANADMWRPW